jgi:GT2 family glycosyltransferase
MLARIVTCYRQWRHIEAWLDDDRLHNEFTKWIVVNDAPDDPCPDRLAAVARHRQVLMLSPGVNVGRSHARNIGARSTDAIWIEHVDGDDTPLPITEGTLAGFTAIDLAAFPVVHHHPGDCGILERRYEPTPTSAPWRDFYSFLFEDHLPLDVRPAGTLWRRDAYQRIRGYDARFETIEDLHIVWKAKQHGLRIGHAEMPKQSHLDETRSGRPDFTAASQLQFWTLAANSCTQYEKPWIDNQIKIAAQVYFWNSLQHLRHVGIDGYKFRIRESLKWILNRGKRKP